MPEVQDATIPLAGIRVTDTATGQPVDLANLDGVHVMVLMRHRH